MRDGCARGEARSRGSRIPQGIKDGDPLKKLLIGGLGLVACGTNALALGGGSSTPSGDIADVTATPFGGVGVGIALPNTGAAVPFVLGFSLVAVGLVLLAASVWLMSRRREDS